MRDRSVTLVIALLAVLFGGAAALILYDHSNRDQIAKGVRAGGVEVGGLSRGAAEEKVAASLRARMNQPILVREGKRTFRLTPRSLGANFNVTAMVDDAIAASREGGIFARVYRNATGGTVHADVPARVSYSRHTLARFATRVSRDLNRKPQDAKLDFNAAGEFRPIPSHTGIKVDTARLRAQLGSAVSGLAPATIRVPATRTQPKVHLQDLAKEYQKLLVVNRSSFKLNYYVKLKLVKTYNVAIGQVGYDTPTGLYHIQNKAVDPAWNVPNSSWAGSLAGQTIPGGASNNPLKARWMGIYNGAGIHGTADDGSIGSAASHGCIRMHVPDVIDLYDRVEINTPVYIA
ncbi:MAG: L,D-transpeptidase ErfK/SrfK [Solirubrobacteraceae bacterium]|nr:L,D-transpeptidase ErfK/SrfK [Solirubrobacteraceae bacterium]